MNMNLKISEKPGNSAATDIIITLFFCQRPGRTRCVEENFEIFNIVSLLMLHRSERIMHGATSTHHRNVSLNLILDFLVITAFVCLVVHPVAAHAPSDMSISYNETSKEVVVTITHQVPNPQVHYIQEVRTTINGKVVNDSRYTSQPMPDTFTYTYPLLPVPGDTIEVTATCSIAGSISRTMYMPGPTATPGQPGTPPLTQQADLGIIPMLGALLVILGLWRR